METEAAAVSSAPPLSRRDRVFISTLGWLAWALLRALGMTWRCRILGAEHHARLAEEKHPFIISVWHDNIMVPFLHHRGKGVMPMVSHHRDGEMIARTAGLLGYDPIRGSSTRGGGEAFHEAVRALADGRTVSIMPDGPRGPRHQFKPGTILIASRAGAWLLPMTFDAMPKIVFRSWDRMKLPLPFARVVARYGAPIQVPAELEGERLEAFRHEVEKEMNDLDELVARDIAEPHP